MNDRPRSYFVALDLGQAQDFTALVCHQPSIDG